jgi:hypothetical protein
VKHGQVRRPGRRPADGGSYQPGLSSVRDIASQAGFVIEFEPDPEGTRLAWTVPALVGAPAAN